MVTAPSRLSTTPSKPVGAELAPSSMLERQRTCVRSILERIAERSALEVEIGERRRSRDAAADADYHRTRTAQVEEIKRLELEEKDRDEKRRRSVIDAAIKGEAGAKAEFGSASRTIATHFDSHRDTAKADLNTAKSKAVAAHDSAQKQAARERAEKLKPLDEDAAHADALRQRLAVVAADYQKLQINPELPPPAPESYERHAEPGDELFSRLSRMETPLRLLERLIIPKIMKGKREVWIYLVVALPFAAVAYTFGDMIGGGAGLIAGGTLGYLARTSIARLSKTQLERLYTPLTQSLADIDGLAAYARGQVEGRYREAKKRITEQREIELRKAQEAYRKTIKAGELHRDERLRKINEVYAEQMVEVQTKQQKGIRAALDEHERRTAEIRTLAETSLPRIDAEYRALKSAIKADFASEWQDTRKRWRNGMAAAAADLEAVADESRGYASAWDDPIWANRELPRRVPPVIRFGEITLDLEAIPGGVSSDPRLMEGVPTLFRTPASRPFPAMANLLIQSPAEGRQAALAALQASMFRVLTSLPPGQVRFTIIDPIGIGRNFGGFMHLADHDPALVTQQAWTEPRQIEERLVDLAAHMELVAQKYLRNEYATIEEYNAVADEVAEPYRVLVVADFPAKFDEKMAARLAAIASGGTPCGVLCLIAADLSRPLPTGFRLDEIAPYCAHLDWDATSRSLVWDDPDLGGYPLALDPPPPAEFATREIHRMGRSAKEAKRVVVPFDFIAPPEPDWWTGDTRSGIDVPLGKSGATKRQPFQLGSGTSQHVLVAGRTGSGKSTLMHALIVNLALRYSPDEIDLYLIDFKKGVEFKVYATLGLPHASVVAIESEREFGISVLERLDAELRLRADRFREAGVQDVNGYRESPGAGPLPRIMLIVDEFQEFFTEEDKLAQEAASWLDRLVRQGRAFGIHVLLGSQSLGGAFTLARTTLGQMAVRIALQCSETDSHLILSENNPAARMLSRPGEAIYNDANGAPEGNHFFQVVWLSEESRASHLEMLRALAQDRPPALKRSTIVFEGDAPAELARCRPLAAVLEVPTWEPAPRSAKAWLGEAISIKDPTSVLFRRQGGNHLLIVGQNDEAALGIVSAVMLGLGTQFSPATSDELRSGARFFVLDGTPEDHPMVGALARAAAAMPHRPTVGDWRATESILAQVAADLERRQQAKSDGPEIFLIVHDLSRFRDLRKKEDDYSFSRREETLSPADQLDLILREGPVLGVHVVVWCDTVTNMNRHFTHQLLREFEMRVLFQMSPNDSGHMIETPHASKLGAHRALLASEDQNKLEKFRPYASPGAEWLSQYSNSLSSRPGL